MPPWTGWNESQVRPATFPPVNAVDFTAINSGSSSPPQAPQTCDVEQTSQSPDHRDIHHAPKTAASAYIGHGESVEPALVVPKKSGGKTKKRASTTCSVSKSKRQKSGDVSENMSVAKSSSRSKKTASVSKTKSKAPVMQLIPNDANLDSVGRAHGQMQPTAPVSVFASITSISNVPPVGQATSLDMLRASSGHGYTAYNGSQTTGARQTGGDFSQPWLKKAAPEANTRSLKPRALHVARHPTLPTVEEEGSSNPPSSSPLPQPSKATPKGSKFRKRAAQQPQDASEKPKPAPNPVTAAEDDFLGSDDELDGQALQIAETMRVTAQLLPQDDKTRKIPAQQPQNVRKKLKPIPKLAAAEDSFLDSDDELDEQALLIADSTQVNVKPPQPPARMTRSQEKQLRIPANSNPANDPSLIGAVERDKPSKLISSDEFDLSDVVEEAIIDLTESVEEQVSFRREKSAPPRKATQNMHAVDADEDYGGALLSAAERQLLDKLASKARQDAPKPIARSPFPPAVLDRSPVYGVSNANVLRTCFRVGEAFNVGCQAVRMNKPVVLELYARVTQSWREDQPSRKQLFIFRDLYHDNPPFINGTFALWDQSDLWDLGSKAFLKADESGSMCRVIAKMKRDGRSWRLEVLSIREASWEDVEYVAGIYARGAE